MDEHDALTIPDWGQPDDPNSVARLAGSRGYVDMVLFDGEQEFPVMVHGTADLNEPEPCKGVISITRDTWQLIDDAGQSLAFIGMTEKLMHRFVCELHDSPSGVMKVEKDPTRPGYSVAMYGFIYGGNDMP